MKRASDVLAVKAVMRKINDSNYLMEALKEAKFAALQGDIPVGAVLVDEEGRIIAKGRNQRNSRGSHLEHAEMNVIREAQEYLYQHPWKATLYCSLEPCVMCLGAAIINHIGRIVWACDDKWAGGTNSLRKSTFLSEQKMQIVRMPIRKLAFESYQLLYEYFSKENPTQVSKVIPNKNLPYIKRMMHTKGLGKR